jgi:hypothetical protein
MVYLHSAHMSSQHMANLTLHEDRLQQAGKAPRTRELFLGIFQHLVNFKFSDVSGEIYVSIFRVQEQIKRRMKQQA